MHGKGGKIVVQLMHTGRVTHVANLPAGAQVVGSMGEVCPGQMYTDAQGMQPHSTPRPMTEEDIADAIGEYEYAARLALEAGFDGVELHAANGYLIEQFLNPAVKRVGMRLSPYGVFNGTGAFPEVDAQYVALVRQLSGLELLYVHVLDHSAQGAPPVSASLKSQLRSAFDGPFILAGGFGRATAEAALAAHQADLIAFGRPYLANPDLAERMRTEAKLGDADAGVAVAK